MKSYWTANGNRACIVCGRDAGPNGRCHAHRRKRPWYDGKWPEISRLRRAQYPICEICGVRPSTQVDHVIPRSMAGGIRAVCAPCHKKHGESYDPSFG